MPTIKLNDRFGAVLNVEPAPASALLRYFRALPAVVAGGLDLSQVGGLTLDNPAVRSFGTGIDFNQGGEMTGVDLSVHAVAQGGFAVIDSPLENDGGALYTRLSIEGRVQPGGWASAWSPEQAWNSALFEVLASNRGDPGAGAHPGGRRVPDSSAHG